MTEERKGHHELQRSRQTEVIGSLRSQREALVAKGTSGWDLFERMAGLSLDHRIRSSNNKCPRCWHDAASRCMCDRVQSISPARIPPVQLIVLMHHKEYMCAGNSAKLLLMMLPELQVKLYIFGREGDFDKLEEDLGNHHRHTMILWPGKSSITVDDFFLTLPKTPVTNRDRLNSDVHNESSRTSPILRAIILDGTYSNAKHMYKALNRRLGEKAPQSVALHPTTVSVFRRAQKKYGAAVSDSIRRSGELDCESCRVCTAEAAALLLLELGGDREVQDAIISAIIANNKALL
mmetsp:Transcript_4188/g.11553  ORF Transcript_4188/g.11553 Transcript_4188/m.11553 type:complete len:292 (-) Transcript_4188:1866-2741(-)|eukprot:CAMPEP_0113552510 /NCGR_PEP_ID=MMETSP0015_2-20120614/15105_1 /TAXON_ID=2838 /ORGANISM="Odontella" /LENGTH=291 /DNA_ID=CAMNT_0000453491 /DNA_START=172 /DNA_END=1047 /DNA_ORIENTATION=- /assembly_acc=CAM_ASM_000160